MDGLASDTYDGRGCQDTAEHRIEYFDAAEPATRTCAATTGELVACVSGR